MATVKVVQYFVPKCAMVQIIEVTNMYTKVNVYSHGHHARV